MPMTGPCQFFRNNENHYKATFNMPMSVPAGYSIKVIALQNTMRSGTAYVNFESLDYTTKYTYFSNQNYFIMSDMGPIEEGSLIYILWRSYSNSITNFYVRILIDTDEVIAAGTAANYMFDGQDTGSVVDKSDI